MPKKKTIATTRTSAKQKFEEYKSQALSYITRLRNPKIQLGFSLKTYEVLVAGGKKPNAISAPELGAIVGTAQKLGKEIRITLSGSGDEATLFFSFVEAPPDIPGDLF